MIQDSFEAYPKSRGPYLGKGKDVEYTLWKLAREVYL